MNLFRSTPLLPCKEERRWIGPSKLVVSQRSVCGVCVCVNVSLENSCFFFQRGFLRVTRIYFNAISRPIQKSRPYSLQAPYSQQCFSKIQTLGKFVAQLIYKFTSLSELGRWVKSCSHLYLRKVFASACEINFSQWVSVVWEGWAFLWQEKSNVWERERVRREWRESKLFEEPWLRRYWSTSFSFSAIELLIFLSKISLSRSRCGYMHNLRDAHKRSLCYC